MPKETALDKFFKTHRSTCTVHIYSGDRRCSCGRDEALKEIEALRKNQVAQLHMNFDERKAR